MFGIFRKRRKRVVLVTPPSVPSPTYHRTNVNESPTIDEFRPSQPFLPLGVAYLASSLEEEDFDVRVIDLTFTIQQKLGLKSVRKAILSLRPDAVGISTYTSTIPFTYQLADAIKDEMRETPVILGGPHVSALPQRTLKECSSIDAVIIGEGEHSFPLFLKSLLSNGLSKELENLKGVLFRHGDDIVGDQNPVYIENVDFLPFPARHLFDLERYKKASYLFSAKQYPVTQIITSRGCPHSCLFCTRINNGHKFRARSSKNIVLELIQLKEYGFNEIEIVDDSFTEDRSRVLEICRGIKEKNLNLSFSLPNGVRVDRVDRELLLSMYQAGFYSISFGVESGDDNVLKINRKGFSVEQIKNAVLTAKRIGFVVKLFTIVGLLGSSVESEEKTLKLIRESEADYAVTSVCTPYPGSPLWDEIKDVIENVPWKRYDEAGVLNPIYLPNGITMDQLSKFLPKK